jgi:sugar phosphate isomerase/epimerase
MTIHVSRRGFLGAVGGVMAGAAFGGSLHAAGTSMFHVSVLTDEIGQDLDHCLSVASKEFGLGYVELRELWGKNIMRLDAKEIEDARRLIERYGLRVSAIASPLYKVSWPGAPKSPYSPKEGNFNADFTFEQQRELLGRCLDVAAALNTKAVRIFDFWRLDDPSPYRAAMDDRLREAAEKAGARGITVVLENEYACNTATSSESVRTLKAVPSPFLKLNWDPGNAAMRGDAAFPEGYRLIPKDRIGHVHCKNIARKPDGSLEWAEMGAGFIDWVAQFRALKADGYGGPVTLETHWRGAGTPEASTRACWASMSRQLREAGALQP